MANTTTTTTTSITIAIIRWTDRKSETEGRTGRQTERQIPRWHRVQGSGRLDREGGAAQKDLDAHSGHELTGAAEASRSLCSSSGPKTGLTPVIDNDAARLSRATELLWSLEALPPASEYQTRPLGQAGLMPAADDGLGGAGAAPAGETESLLEDPRTAPGVAAMWDEGSPVDWLLGSAGRV